MTAVRYVRLCSMISRIYMSNLKYYSSDLSILTQTLYCIPTLFIIDYSRISNPLFTTVVHKANIIGGSIDHMYDNQNPILIVICWNQSIRNNLTTMGPTASAKVSHWSAEREPPLGSPTVVGSRPMCAGNSNYIVKSNQRSGRMKKFQCTFSRILCRSLSSWFGRSILHWIHMP